MSSFLDNASRIRRLLFLAFLAIAATTLILNRPIRIVYHTLQLRDGSRVSKDSHLRFHELSVDEWHRDQLVHLGAMFERKYILDRFENRRDARVLIGEKIVRRFPNNRLWRLTSSFDDATMEPLELEVWDFLSVKNDWDRFVQTLDSDHELLQFKKPDTNSVRE